MTLPVVSAKLTNLARHLNARSQIEGITYGDWSFAVGSGGYNPLNPLVADPVDPTQQTLAAPVGGSRQLGRILLSGTGASIAPSIAPGYATVSGMAGLPNLVKTRWLHLYGSANPAVNGLWRMGKRFSATSVEIANPLAVLSDPGPLNWEVRESCILLPNARADDFQCRIAGPDAIDNTEIGQVGVFCRILRSPADPLLIGMSVLYARANHPPKVKVAASTVVWHLCVQH